MIGGKKKMQTVVIAIAAFIAGEIAGVVLTAQGEKRTIRRGANDRCGFRSAEILDIPAGKGL